MSFSIRRMREEDIPQAVEIEQLAFTRPWSENVFRATLLLPYAAYYAAVETGETADRPFPAAHGPVEEEERNEQGTRPCTQDASAVPARIAGICGVKKIFETGEISNVAVHPDFRGRGISRKMLEVLMREAREDGVEEFTLEVRAGNVIALNLYESLGFRAEGLRPRFYDQPVEDGLVMWLRKTEDHTERA